MRIGARWRWGKRKGRDKKSYGRLRSERGSRRGWPEIYTAVTSKLPCHEHSFPASDPRSSMLDARSGPTNTSISFQKVHL